MPGILLQASMGYNMKQALDGKADSNVWIGIIFSILTTIFMSWQVQRIWTSLPTPDSAHHAAVADDPEPVGSAYIL